MIGLLLIYLALMCALVLGIYVALTGPGLIELALTRLRNRHYHEGERIPRGGER